MVFIIGKRKLPSWLDSPRQEPPPKKSAPNNIVDSVMAQDQHHQQQASNETTNASETATTSNQHQQHSLSVPPQRAGGTDLKAIALAYLDRLPTIDYVQQPFVDGRVVCFDTETSGINTDDQVKKIMID